MTNSTKTTLIRHTFGDWELRILQDKNEKIQRVLIIKGRTIKFESMLNTKSSIDNLVEGLNYVKENSLTDEQMYKHLNEYSIIMEYK